MKKKNATWNSKYDKLNEKYKISNKKYRTLNKKYRIVNRILKKYDNDHTPPSHRGTNTKLPKRIPPTYDGEPGRQGGQPGHIGTIDSTKPIRIERHRGNWRFGKFIDKLNYTILDLFRFVIDPTIPPTNNAAEHGST